MSRLLKKMPLFRLTTVFADTCLEVVLLENEHVTDAVLALVHAGTDKLCFSRSGTGAERLVPMDIACSAEALGRVDPTSLSMHGVVSGMEGATLARCARLETLYIGASADAVFREPPTSIMNDTFKNLALNGFGLVKKGEGMASLIAHLKSHGREHTEYC